MEALGEDRIRILIADDHTLFRQGLKTLLQLDTGLEVVGEAGSCAEVVALAASLDPDVVILDINMPGGGLEAAVSLRSQNPRAGLVMLTMHEDQEYLMKALKIGAHSYLVKDVESADLADAIRSARAGRPYLHPKLASLALMSVARGETKRDSELSELTERELEVLRLVGQGASNRDIAASLFISEKTAKNHLTHIFEKLGVTDRTQAALYAVRHGLVDIRQR